MTDESMSGDPLNLTVEGFEARDTLWMLESAISAVASTASDSENRTALILDDHLKSLCALQLRHLERLTDYEYAAATGLDFEFSE